LSDRRGASAFELAADNLGDNRLHLTDRDGSFGEAGRRVITVSTERLDDVVDATRLAQPVAVKVDTQGSECRVLAGGARVLDAASIFAFEFWPYGIRRMGDDPDALIRLVPPRFSTGPILASDTDETVAWQPIGAVVDHLAALARRVDAPYATCDVVVRR
ncbi:MAG: FkbM family methyltransferase, partial [Alphaproteobacteria bacterium]|nr:FkbM family methyltransferase [Alphaproteobacteria bacterium]